MIPQEIIDIIQKYEIHDEFSSEINISIGNIISTLKKVNNQIKNNLFDIMDSEVGDKEDELHNDSRTLRNFINSISLIENSTLSENITTEQIYEEPISKPIFEKRVYPYLVDDDICPFCNVKLYSYTVYYQRIINNEIAEEQAQWYRCPSCRKMFAIDYDVDDFDFTDTNIYLNKSEYNKIPDINIYSIIVLSNTLKCSSQHDIKDIIAKIPIIDENGQFSYLNVNASYCKECNRFTILKSDFNAIRDIIIAKVIDETSEYSESDENNFVYEQGKSELAYYGYNVQTKKNISEQQRHIILSSIIESQIMSRREVIDHISILIERGSKIPSWKQATQKWKDDRAFVSTYESDSLPEVIFNNIVLKYKKPR